MSDAEKEAAANAATGDAADDVRTWLIQNTVATLATLSVDARCTGYPFTSIVPFALDGRGQPLLQIASIAAHTKNARADARASLFVHQPAPENDDPQAGWRISVIGKLAPVANDEREEMLARLAERVKSARAYEKTHDFSIWRLEIEHVRYIAGFGRIGWVEGKDAVRDPHGGGLHAHAAGAVAHMNADHVASMKDMCAGFYGFTPESVAMTAIDRAGFFVRTTGPDQLVYFSFGREIEASSLRTAVVDVVKRARSVAPRT